MGNEKILINVSLIIRLIFKLFYGTQQCTVQYTKCLEAETKASALPILKITAENNPTPLPTNLPT
jgi:hypothetical protein